MEDKNLTYKGKTNYLAKQGWRIIQDHNSLLAQCLKARYFPRTDFLQSSIGYLPSYNWRSIHQGKKTLEKGCLWRVGSGTSTDIWRHNWLPSQFGYKVWSPEPSNTNLTCVSQLIDHENNCWNQQLVSSIFMQFEAQQISQILLPNQFQQDYLIWGPDRRGEFSAKSAYHFIRAQAAVSHNQNSDASQIPDYWNKLWNVNSIPRHPHLLWRILHDRLPSRFSLFKRGIISSPMCPRCNDKIETASHIFMECEWANLVWFASPLGVRFLAHSREGMEFKDWLARSISQHNAKTVQLIFPICYELWFARNKLCFEQLLIPIPQIINKAVSSVEELKAKLASPLNILTQLATTSDLTANSLSVWTPPPINCYKLNVDVAGPVNDKWGIGVILRDFAGLVMAAGRWRIACLNDAAVAEAVALQMGMKFALELLFLNVQAESDSTTVVAAMRSDSILNNYMGMIIQDCKTFNSQFSSFSCTHLRRNVNQAAYGLAKSALSSDDSVWVEEIPSCISNIISLDCSTFHVG